MNKKQNEEYYQSDNNVMFEFREDVDKQTIELWDTCSDRRIVLKAVLQDAKSITTYLENLRARLLNGEFASRHPEDFIVWLFEPSETDEKKKTGEIGLIQWNSDCGTDYEQFVQELETTVTKGALSDEKYRFLVDAIISKGGPKGYCDEEIWDAFYLRDGYLADFYYMRNDPNVQDADKQQSKINILYVSDK